MNPISPVRFSQTPNWSFDTKTGELRVSKIEVVGKDGISITHIKPGSLDMRDANSTLEGFTAGVAPGGDAYLKLNGVGKGLNSSITLRGGNNEYLPHILVKNEGHGKTPVVISSGQDNKGRVLRNVSSGDAFIRATERPKNQA